jgi:acetate---CoA ligase (ADP-forming)
VLPPFDNIQVDRARAVVGQALERGDGWLSPAELQDLFDAVGITMAQSRLVKTVDEAVQAARALEYPVVLKAVGPRILHKSEVGGVRLNLAGEAAVRQAGEEMAARLGEELSGLVVQEMVMGGVEVVVGATLDPTFGPLIVYGSGGILVEMLNDVAFRINPLTDVDVADMLNEVKGTALLRGWRGGPAADEAALKELILRVSVLLEICPQIHEMDANPVKVLAQGATVVDARIRVARLSDPPPTRRIDYF